MNTIKVYKDEGPISPPSNKGTPESKNPFRAGTQASDLIEFFLDHPNVWHAQEDLIKVARSSVLHPKITAIRYAGMSVENRVESAIVDGKKVSKSYYRFISTEKRGGENV